jgi:hypothetical protein
VIPGLSETKAQNLIKHYPSLRSLRDAYEAIDGHGDDVLAQREREGLLADKFGKRKEGALSQKIYRVFTSDDADEVL